ncbi:MAG: hypothetical protein HQM13_04085 [SAR324 cluster bacterium]|nr:hypothetical protein [SAR324 cluster bacterium]
MPGEQRVNLVLMDSTRKTTIQFKRKTKAMAKLQIRPRFQMSVSLSPEEVRTRIHNELGKTQKSITGKLLTDFILLNIAEEQQHYWSPELSLEIKEQPEGSLIKGIFGPKSAVWTMFASFYALNLFIGVIGAMFGISQWMIDQYSYGFWAIPVSLLLFFSAYGIAYAGQKLAHEEIVLLQAFLKNALK